MKTIEPCDLRQHKQNWDHLPSEINQAQKDKNRMVTSVDFLEDEWNSHEQRTGKRKWREEGTSGTKAQLGGNNQFCCAMFSRTYAHFQKLQERLLKALAIQKWCLRRTCVADFKQHTMRTCVGASHSCVKLYGSITFHFEMWYNLPHVWFLHLHALFIFACSSTYWHVL